jgi:MurNAc alpha-1-phosphate uridylyltransferase
MSSATPAATFAAQAIILAAGRGARMRPLTDTCPKPLLQVQGKPLLRWHSDALAASGFTQQLLNAGWLHQQITAYISEHFGDISAKNLPEQLLKEKQSSDRRVAVSDEMADFGAALETLGGIARALPQLADVFWVVAGDIYAPEFVFAQADYAAFAASNALAHVFLVPNPEHNSRGDFCINADGRLRVIDAMPQGAETYTFSTIALYKKALFESPYCDIPAGNPQGLAAPLAPLLRHAANHDVISASVYAGAWVDVGTPERLAALNAG